MDSTVHTVLLYQFTNDDNVQMEKTNITVESFQVCSGEGVTQTVI